MQEINLIWTRRRALTFAGAATAALVGFGTAAAAPAPAPDKNKRPVAPELPQDPSRWLNTGNKALSLKGLRGRVVLLDFWTYGCVNCLHVLPDLKRLERKYARDLVVISVHSAKFKNEGETANVRNAVLRYNIEHPVLNDRDMAVWNAYGARAWPTLVLVDPHGRVVGAAEGEGNYDVLDRAIGQLITARRAGANGRGVASTTAAPIVLEAARTPATPLWYPGKVLADPASDTLFIADTNHNRIVIADRNGHVRAVAGSGVAGRADGPFDAATFRAPQGMALRSGAAGGALILYVADTNNHLVRALDLQTGTVTTVAGTGAQAPGGASGGTGTQAPLSSPWDLLLSPDGTTLYIAMAGLHQIWAMDLASGKIGPYAGSGREARDDGALVEAAFAQPSGLATDGRRLFVADSESGTNRAVILPGAETQQAAPVQTLAGGDLFDFGDTDGVGEAARFQHPLGLAWDAAANRLFIADTYNHKIKTLDPATGRTETWLGGGGGNGDKNATDPRFSEPGGISVAGGNLYVADTNNHQIRVVNIATKATTTLRLTNLPAARPAEPDRSRLARPGAKNDTITLPLVVLAPNAPGEIVLDVLLPPGHKLNPLATQRAQARVEGAGLTLAQARVSSAAFTLPLRLAFSSGAPGARGVVVVSAAIFYCSDEKGVCKMGTLRFRAPFEVRTGGADAVAAAGNTITLRSALR